MGISRRTLLAALAGAPAAGLVACSSSSGDASGGKPKVVASTNVWGMVASAVAGADADVAAIIDQPDQDPHDYEASARDKLAIQQAAVIVVNGGGYDDWASSLAQSGSAPVVDAVKASGLPGAGSDGFNEHVWYSMAAVAKVATAIAEALAKADAAHAAAYRSRAAQFGVQVKKLAASMKQFGAAHPGVKALMTEPVAGYLLQQYGYTNATPAAFIEQSESDDVAPATLAAAKNALSSKAANLLIVNPQTSTPVTDQLLAAAKSSSVPTAQVRETAAGESDFAAFVASATGSIEKAVTA